MSVVLWSVCCVFLSWFQCCLCFVLSCVLSFPVLSSLPTNHIPNYAHVSHLCPIVSAPFPVYLNPLLLVCLSVCVLFKSTQYSSCCIVLCVWITDLTHSANLDFFFFLTT